MSCLGRVGVPADPLPLHPARAGQNEKEPYIAWPSQEKSLLEVIKTTRQKLIAGLESVERPDGWRGPTGKATQPLWTAIEVLTSLVESDVFPRHYHDILYLITRAEKHGDEFSGWEFHGVANRISVFATADVVRLYLVLRKFDLLGGIINNLQRARNHDGGWGVCNGDTTSRVRSTAWVLRTFIWCLNTPPTKNLINPTIVSRGLTWLNKAQNRDRGWGDEPGYPSNVTATVLALDALLGAVRYCQLSGSNDFPFDLGAIKQGLERLISMRNAQGYWEGQEQNIYLDAELGAAEHGTNIHLSASGTTLVIQTLIKAAQVGLLHVEDRIIYDAVVALTERCVSYRNAKGVWLFPSEARRDADDSDYPVAWNSAFALDALHVFEKFYMEYLAGSWIERKGYDLLAADLEAAQSNLQKTLTDLEAVHSRLQKKAERLKRRVKVWRGIALTLFIGAAAVGIILLLRALDQLPEWFEGLSLLYQDLITIILSLIAGSLYSTFLHSRLVSAFRKAWKMLLRIGDS